MQHCIHQTKIFFAFIGLTVWLLIACGGSNRTFQNVPKKYQNIYMFAWNEDTIHSYKFLLTKDNRFLYTIENNDTIKSKKQFTGIVLNDPTNDTLYLEYDKKGQKHDMKHYLVREAFGRYLIQSFAKDKKRIFLRIENLFPR